MPVYKSYEHIPVINHAGLAKIISTNINQLCQTKLHPKKTIAELCDVSPSLVTKWTSAKTPVMPAVDNLLTIAAYFGVDLTWLITEHEGYILPDYTQTYRSALLALISLLDKHIIECDFVDDPILGYLLERYRELSEARIEKREFDVWMEHIIKEFDIPIGEFHKDKPLQDDIVKNESGIAAVDTDTKYRNLARALNDNEVTARAYQRVYGNVEKQ